MFNSTNNSGLLGIDNDGFWSLFDEAFKEPANSYPPYNLITEKDQTVVEVATAGFKREELNVRMKNGDLVVTGKLTEPDEREYIRKGIATRSFTHTFKSKSPVEVAHCEYADGILQIVLRSIEEDNGEEITIK